MINPHHLSPLSLTSLLSEPTNDPVTVLASPETATPTLTIADSSPETPHHFEVAKYLRRTEDRLGYLGREFENMKVELAVLKEEHKSLKEHIIGLPNQIGSQIQEVLSNLWKP